MVEVRGWRDTGFPGTDAQFDFGRARRSRALSRLADRFRGEPERRQPDPPLRGGGGGARAARRAQPRACRRSTLDSIVGPWTAGASSIAASAPPRARSATRWERIAAAQRRGEPMPPIDVYRIGELHFVKDGHHRVSVARAMRHDKIDAYVTEVITRSPRAGIPGRAPAEEPRAVVPRAGPAAPKRASASALGPSGYAGLAEGVEAGFRMMQAARPAHDREQVADVVLDEEYQPVVEMLREAGGPQRQERPTPTGRVSLRYLLLTTHEWDEADPAAGARADRAPVMEKAQQIRKLRKDLRN